MRGQSRLGHTEVRVRRQVNKEETQRPNKLSNSKRRYQVSAPVSLPGGLSTKPSSKATFHKVRAAAKLALVRVCVTSTLVDTTNLNTLWNSLLDG